MKKLVYILKRLTGIDAWIAAITLPAIISYLMCWLQIGPYNPMAQYAKMVDPVQAAEAAKAPFAIDWVSGDPPIWTKEYNAWLMHLPARGGGASIIDIRSAESGNLSLAEVVRMEKVQLQKSGWIVQSELLDTRGWSSSGMIGRTGGEDYRRAMRIMVHGGKTVIATATARRDHWATDDAALVSCIDSLRPRAAMAPPADMVAAAGK